MGGAIGHANQHEPATAEVPRLRMHHRQHKAGGHCGVNGIAPGLHDFYSRT